MQHGALEILLGLLGLCVGSFLNVVIYRWPRGLSILRPSRSFCPHCRKTITWLENVPILSWLLQRGRCRGCGTLISAQYPLIEALTGLAYVLVYHLLFVDGARNGASLLVWPFDAPLLVSWLVLVSALIACSAMDVVSYMVDIRLTDIAMYCGIVCHALWPRPAFFAARAAEPLSAAAAAGAIAALLLLLRPRSTTSEDVAPQDEHPTEPDPKPRSGPARAAAIAGALLCLAAAVFLIAHPYSSTSLSFWQVAPVPIALGLMFFSIVLAGGQERESDDEVRGSIEDEAPHARRVALAELGWLSVILITSGIAFALLNYSESARSAWLTVTAWSPGAGIAPVGGAAFAILGAMIGAAAGWTLRVLFTLIFGREAFGTGDIYILAAAGAAGGWDIALLGLGLSVMIALVGWVFTLLLKRTVMIPFGPWLALGFLAALWLSRSAAGIAYDYGQILKQMAEQEPSALWLIGAVLLAGFVIAVTLAKVVRKLVEPKA